MVKITAELAEILGIALDEYSPLFPGRFFGQTAWEASQQEEVWRTFLDKQRSAGKQLQRSRDDRRRGDQSSPYS